mmetsp:Transcript_112506/g.363317  ORF Transcript_112506/g.363317 Transcript_112506/m.363317 type:complete len:160 (+) Transcript_112506:1587-2066(+)
MYEAAGVIAGVPRRGDGEGCCGCGDGCGLRGLELGPDDPAAPATPAMPPAPGVAAAPAAPAVLAPTAPTGAGGAGNSCRIDGSPQRAARPSGVATGRSPRQKPAPSMDGGRLEETGGTADFCGEGPPSTDGVRQGPLCAAARAVTGGMWLPVPCVAVAG